MDRYKDKATEIMKGEISKNIKFFDGRVLLLFSGGRDSVAVAASFCMCFPFGKLVLVTFDNGISSNVNASKKQAQCLKELYPKVDIVHKILSSKWLMKKAVISNIENDFLKDGFSSLLVCVGCKFVMNYMLLKTALEMDIKIVMDGFSERQRHYPEQTKEFMDYIEKMYRRNNVVYLSPFYNLFKSSNEVIDFLLECGFAVCEQQPICIIGGTYTSAKPKEVENYLIKCVKRIEVSMLGLTSDE